MDRPRVARELIGWGMRSASIYPTSGWSMRSGPSWKHVEVIASLVTITNCADFVDRTPRSPRPPTTHICFGGINGCHPVRGFTAWSNFGNGACGLDAADGSRGLHARRATSLYRRRISLVQRRDSERRPRQGLPAEEQGAAELRHNSASIRFGSIWRRPEHEPICRPRAVGMRRSFSFSAMAALLLAPAA